MNLVKYKQIFSNLNYKNVFFPVFAAMLCCFYAFKSSTFPLQIFERGIVSAATLEMLDINQRVNLFWNAFGCGSFIFIFVVFIQNIFCIRCKEIAQHIALINLISFFGIFIILHSILSTEQNFSLGLIIYTIGFIGISAFISIISGKTDLSEKHNFLSLHFWYLVTGFLIYLIINNFNLYISEKSFGLLLVFPFEIALCMMIGLSIYAKYKKISLDKLFKYSFPLVIFVLWNFASNEFNYILNQHSIFIRPFIVFLLGYIFILSFFLIKWNMQQNKTAKSASAQLANYYLPLLLVIIACYAYYMPVLSPISELFETANPANSIMLSCKFGKLPFFEYLNSHALSETFFGFIYVLLNGFNGSLDFFIYDFIHQLLLILIVYYFLRKLTKNAYFAFTVSLLLPFQEIMFCDIFSYSLISIFLLYRMYSNPVYKNYILGFVWSFFLILWRIDVGYANIAAFFLVSVMLILTKYKRKNLQQFCLSFLGVVLSFATIVFLVVWLRKIDLLTVIRQSLHYLSGNQAHGALSIYAEPERLFIMHYIVFPAVIVFSFLIIMLRLKHFIRKNAFVIISILFLSFIYLFNIPRGLVRHGFNEGSDFFISSFVYLILSLILFFIVSGKLSKSGHLILIASLYFLIVAFKFPDIKDYSTVFEKYAKAFKDFRTFNNSSVKIKRYNEDSNFALENYSAFKNFMDTHCNNEATFIDFSNTPLLYFYTKRIVPSFFPQYMQNTIDDDLQFQNIADFKKYDIPVVVFSNQPCNWFDATDGVSNTIRYNKIAAYIYANYQPYDTMSKHSIWLKKGNALLHLKTNRDNLLIPPFSLDLKKLPFMEGNYSDKVYLGDLLYQWKTNQIITYPHRKIILPLHIDKSKGNYLVLNYERKDTIPQKCYITLSNDSIRSGVFSFDVLNKAQKEKYAIRLSTQYVWYLNKITSIMIGFENEFYAPAILSVQLHKAR